MPLCSARTSTSPGPGSARRSSRISPCPGSVTQNARADGSVSILPVEFSLIRLYHRHHPHPHFGAANYVTLVRALLTVGLLGLVLLPPSSELGWVAGVIAGVIAALDGLDGWLARRSAMASAFGARFDMETDAALLMVLSVLAWRHDKAGAWVLMIGLMRYAFVGAGWLLPWLTARLTPTRRGKTVAVVQMVVLAVILVLPRTVANPLAAIALGLLTWSFAIDIRRLWQAPR